MSIDEPVPVRNPFVSLDDYSCFGCDPHNPLGLHLEFQLSGDTVIATWEPRDEYQGYPGVIHGGIQATVADEIAGWCVYAILGTAGVTRSIAVEYLEPARLQDGPFRLTGRVTESDSKTATITVTLANDSGATCAVATCRYAVFSETVARRRFHFPGRQAFVE